MSESPTAIPTEDEFHKALGAFILAFAKCEQIITIQFRGFADLDPHKSVGITGRLRLKQILELIQKFIGLDKWPEPIIENIVNLVDQFLAIAQFRNAILRQASIDHRF